MWTDVCVWEDDTSSLRYLGHIEVGTSSPTRLAVVWDTQESGTRGSSESGECPGTQVN